ncbi:hypothetical protein [Lysinibacillus fusiformis]|uniref:hypothetical protein n=1 Tax=Lysinibacillus fusiformis TaxID=28031 RepID=UPI000507699E|nr:hypothetical protein [Lysinibacillus fusiformis]KGA80657.1 hypothetical protein KQ41_17545 [Lysinibacillus fusiformis]
MKVQQSTDGGINWIDSTLVAVFDGPNFNPNYNNPILTETSYGVRIGGLMVGTTYHLKLVVTGGIKDGDSNIVVTTY